MRKSMLLLVTLFMVLTLTGLAWAEYGEWEDLGGLNPPGLSNAAYMDISAASETELYTVGMWQTGALDIDYAWRSTDGGESYRSIYGISIGSNICDALMIMNFFLQVQALGPDEAILMGFGVNPDCLEKVEEPWCLFVCMFTLSPMIMKTTDGGASYTRATVPFGFMRVSEVMDRADDGTLFVGGGPNLLLKSTNDGDTWTEIPTPDDAGEEFYVSGIQFIDEDYGFIVSGEMDPEKEIKSDNEALDFYQKTIHRIRYRTDPAYRIEYWQNHSGDMSKGLNGRLYRTTDGGQTWELLKREPQESFLNLLMTSEDEGWMIGDPFGGGFVLYKTEDGGDTWDDVTNTVPFAALGSMPFAISAMTFNEAGNVGFLGGGGQQFITYTSVLFYTLDGGDSWHHDANLLPWGHPILSFDWWGPRKAWQGGFDLSTYRYTQNNVAPIADAGDDQEVEVNTIVTLDGSASYDPDGDDITYAWAQLSGPDATLTSTDEAMPSFTAAEAGALVFELTVSDGEEDDSDEVTITVVETGDDDDDAVDDDDDSDDDDDDDDQTVDDDDDDDDDDGCGC